MNKKYQIFKTIFFILIGILVLVFSSTLTNNAYLLVGGLMLMYGIEDLIVKILVKKVTTNIPKVANDFLIILLGVVALFLGPEEHFKSLCIIWATWAILREAWEVEEVVLHLKNKVIAIISIVESIAVIVICVFFIFEPTIEHVHIHVILLGIELMLEVLFPLLNDLLGHKKEEAVNKE